MKTIHLIGGARPNFMKVAPLYRSLVKREWAKPILVNTQQHRDNRMAADIWRELQLPNPDYLLETTAGTPESQLAQIVKTYGEIVRNDKPDACVVVGDVTSTLACSIVARYNRIPLVHAEAGLRSGDVNMLEETNRIMVDSISSLLWTTTDIARHNLLAEGVSEEKISVIGNLMVDSLESIRSNDKNDANHENPDSTEDPYAVVTLHRPGNVDFDASLSEICQSLVAVSNDIRIVWPMHPRTEARLAELPLRSDLFSKVEIIPPLPYIEFQRLMTGARLIITDSGGIQEETTYLGIPCLTLRPNTERPETVIFGTNRLVESDTLHAEVRNILGRAMPPRPGIPYWDGQASERACDSLEKFLYRG